jgi:hypothetical protein
MKTGRGKATTTVERSGATGASTSTHAHDTRSHTPQETKHKASAAAVEKGWTAVRDAEKDRKPAEMSAAK